MDAIEILGSLLGQRSGGGGMAGKILRDVLGGGGRSEQPPPSRASSRETPSRPLQPQDIESQARELEDLLHVANERRAERAPAGPDRGRAARPRQDAGFGSNAPRMPPQPAPRQEMPRQRDYGQQFTPDQDEKALVLVRAMVNAAKSDGQISQAEQQAIIDRIGDTSQETIQFLREEFQRPCDVREFAWSVPLGLEQQVYSISLMAIELDSNREATYLKELAHGLRLAPDVCQQIHERLGVPQL